MHGMHYSCEWQYLAIPEHILHHPAFGTSSTLSRLKWGCKEASGLDSPVFVV